MLPFKLNFKASPLDTRDHVIQPLGNSGNSSVDLSSWCTSIKNQGSIGSCTAHAGVAFMELFYRKHLGGIEDDLFSEKFVYYTTRVNIAGWPANNDSGAYIRDTMKSMVKIGVALEKTWPYCRAGENDCRYTDAPPPNAYDEASRYQVTSYARILENDKTKCLQDVKKILDSGLGFIGGFYCYENLFSAQNGIIPLPQGKQIGGHAVMFVGYDDQKQLFKFKNSWGINWGENGYGYLPYQYLLRGLLIDLWTIYRQENNNISYGLVTPAVRETELKSRVAELLTQIGTMNIQALQQKISTDPRNAYILTSDVAELLNLVARIDSLCYLFFASAAKRQQ